MYFIRPQRLPRDILRDKCIVYSQTIMNKKKNYYKQHVCQHCGRVFYGRGNYCRKHAEQKRKYGYFLDCNPRTPNDPNEIIWKDGCTQVVTYDKNCNPNYYFKIDIEDLPLVTKYKWHASVTKQKNGLIYMSNNEVGFYHILLMQPNKGETVDHINRNTFDNRKCNLRIVSQTEQNHNQKVRDNIRFDIKGIDKHKDPNREKRYMARFSMNKITYRSPWYKTYEEAVFARYLLQQLAKVEVINNNIQKYIEKLTEEQKLPIIKWFTNRFKDRV